jgi:carbon-monoxide dehydrogenase medium subunit
MKPPPFKYVRATTLEQATAALRDGHGEAKILAGGQSLVPMLNFRLLRPATLVDINALRELDFVSEMDGGLRIGALTRHYTLETSALVADRFPILAEAIRHVAHLAIRNRGTIGGSLSHADPAAELPAIVRLLDATIVTAAPDRGRAIAARDFFLGPLTTTLAEDEIVTAVELPALPAATGWGFEEFSHRHGDFAIAGAAATLTLSGRTCIEARIAVIGGPVAARASAAEALLTGQTLDSQTIAAAAHAASEEIEPEDGIHASAEFRRHLIGVLTGRALNAALRRASALQTAFR